jgi:hypothetical protein
MICLKLSSTTMSIADPATGQWSEISLSTLKGFRSDGKVTYNLVGVLPMFKNGSAPSSLA